MTNLTEIKLFLDNFLEISKFPKDPSNNGLQVEGKNEVSKALFAVDACQKLFDIAVTKNADFIFTHHGLSWGDNFRRLTDINAARLRTLFKNDISLYAAHLPLDAHSEIGHNAEIATLLNLNDLETFGDYAGSPIGFEGLLPTAQTLDDLASSLSETLNCKPKIVCGGNTIVKRVGIVSGGAADLVLQAREKGLDCFITGEMGHSDYHLLNEVEIPTLLLGHYRSECPGILAVMELVDEKFEIECEFIDLPSGL